jgi:hypothetical protein
LQTSLAEVKADKYTGDADGAVQHADLLPCSAAFELVCLQSDGRH